MNKTKIQIVFFFILRHKIGNEVQEVGFSNFRERVCAFSLDFPPFKPSVRFGPRSKVVIRQEVGIFSYLVYSLAKGHFMDVDLLRPRRPCYQSQKL